MKVVGVKGTKLIDNGHDVHLDNVPTRLKEGSGKTIRARRFVTCGFVDRIFNFLLREGRI